MKLFQQLLTRFQTGFIIVARVNKPLGNIIFPAHILISAVTQGSAGISLRPAQADYIPASVVYEVLCCDPASFIMISLDICDFSAARNVSVHHNHRQGAGTDDLLCMAAICDQDDAVRLHLLQHTDIGNFFFGFISRTAQHNMESSPICLLFNNTGQFIEERVHDIRKDEADQAGRILKKGPCKHIRLKPRFPDRLLHTLSLFIIHFCRPVHNTGNGGR